MTVHKARKHTNNISLSDYRMTDDNNKAGSTRGEVQVPAVSSDSKQVLNDGWVAGSRCLLTSGD